MSFGTLSRPFAWRRTLQNMKHAVWACLTLSDMDVFCCFLKQNRPSGADVTSNTWHRLLSKCGVGGAPISRALVLATAGSSVVVQAVRAARRPLPAYAAAWENTFVFRHPGELLFGVGLLYYFRCGVTALRIALSWFCDCRVHCDPVHSIWIGWR